MSRASDYMFVNSNADTITNGLIAAYQAITGRTVQPGSVDRLFIAWVADVIVQTSVKVNYAGNQNIPSRAEGENLDALGELFYDSSRPEARAATVIMRFNISEAQASAILVPVGTRVTTGDNSVIFETLEDAYVAIGTTYVDVQAECQITGAVGNGFVTGQINTLVDPFPYFQSCENTDESAGGADKADDDEYYDLMVASMDAYSCAGAKGAYIYWAKSVSTEIADVVANSPLAGRVYLYILMKDGTLAGQEIKQAVLAACDEDSVRPFTELVAVEDANIISYDIELTYYIPSVTTQSAADIEGAVDNAVNEYVSWQAGKFGRDINPSKLISLIMAAGVKRVMLTSPTFMTLSDGSLNTTPDIAQVGTITVTNGGYEDE